MFYNDDIEKKIIQKNIYIFISSPWNWFTGTLLVLDHFHESVQVVPSLGEIYYLQVGLLRLNYLAAQKYLLVKQLLVIFFNYYLGASTRHTWHTRSCSTGTRSSTGLPRWIRSGDCQQLLLQIQQPLGRMFFFLSPMPGTTYFSIIS